MASLTGQTDVVRLRVLALAAAFAVAGCGSTLTERCAHYRAAANVYQGLITAVCSPATEPVSCAPDDRATDG